jgi:hypothetical protein
MHKMNRRGVFLVATLCLGIALSGCGKGAGPDSPYRGAYRANYTLPAVGETGTFTYTVEQKGSMIGSFQDINTGKISNFNGKIEPSGNFSGTTVMDGATINTRGTFSLTGSAGAGGDFDQQRNGSTLRGSFVVTTDGIETGGVNSSFQGAYKGSYTIPGLTQNGLVNFSVNARGEIIGQMTRGEETASLLGTIQESGSFVMSAQFSDGAAGLTGTLIKTADFSTSGNFTYSVGGRSFSGAFGTTQVGDEGDSVFQGAYRGTYVLPEAPTFATESGTVSFTVSPRGVIVGDFTQSANQPTGIFTGNIKNDGTFVGNVTYDAASGRSARLITGTIGTSNVSGGRAGNFFMTINGVNRAGSFEIEIGGSEADSIYRGAYGGPSIVDGVSLYELTGVTTLDFLLTRPDADSLATDEFGNARPTQVVTTLSVTFDKQGNSEGTLGGRPFNVRATNDGRFFGTWAGFPIRGNISRQEISELQNFNVNPVRDADGDITGYNITYTYEFREGFAGDFVVTVNGREFSGNLVGIGGNAEGAQPR